MRKSNILVGVLSAIFALLSLTTLAGCDKQYNLSLERELPEGVRMVGIYKQTAVIGYYTATYGQTNTIKITSADRSDEYFVGVALCESYYLKGDGGLKVKVNDTAVDLAYSDEEKMYVGSIGGVSTDISIRVEVEDNRLEKYKFNVTCAVENGSDVAQIIQNSGRFSFWIGGDSANCGQNLTFDEFVQSFSRVNTVILCDDQIKVEFWIADGERHDYENSADVFYWNTGREFQNGRLLSEAVEGEVNKLVFVRQLSLENTPDPVSGSSNVNVVFDVAALNRVLQTA